MNPPFIPAFAPTLVASYCARWAPSIQAVIPSTIDAARLLWAFTGNESSFGAYNGPRHEPAYDVGGRYAVTELLDRFGSAAACSYGPLQIMFFNCPAGTTPDEMTQIDVAFMCSINFMKNRFQHYSPQTVSDCGAIWKGGHIPAEPWPDEILAYTQKLTENYNAPGIAFEPQAA